MPAVRRSFCDDTAVPRLATMKVTFRPTARAGAASLLACVLLSACTNKSSNPLSPSVAGPIAGVSITPPKTLEPIHQASVVEGTPVTLLIENSSTSGQRPIWLQLEVALDPEFQQRVHTVERLDPGPNGRTSYALPIQLTAGRAYFWRARAVDGANTGPYSPSSMFQVALGLRIETPVPVSPVRREVTADAAVQLVVSNTAVTGTPGGPVVYRFELAQDLGFTQMVAVYSAPRSESGTTAVQTTPLPLDREFYWRVNASDGGYTSPYSIAQAFRTPAPVAPPPAPNPGPSPSPEPGPPPSPGPVGPNRSISADEVLRIVRQVHDSLGYNLGSSSTREYRINFLWTAMAVVHYGHSRFNPQGADPGWCVKDAGGGRPPSDDVIVRCSSRDAWDIIGGAGANGYNFHLDGIGRLPGDQNVYPPPQSALPR
jgi:hypothetical protein